MKDNRPYKLRHPAVVLLERLGMKIVPNTYFGCYKIGVNRIGRILIGFKIWWIEIGADPSEFYKFMKSQIKIDHINKDKIEVERIFITN